MSNKGPARTANAAAAMDVDSTGGPATVHVGGHSLRADRMASYEPDRRAAAHMSATGRAVPDDAKHPTGVPQPVDKSYKTDADRVHWKGYRVPQAAGGAAATRTTGIRPFSTARSTRAWSDAHRESRDRMGAWLWARDKEFKNPYGGHAAENSHGIAASLYGPNDVLSAPPASIHQNTEWLAIEQGIKALDKSLHDSLLVKATLYVHNKGEEKGWLKAARYKISLGGKTVFDHVAMGARGNIDESETRTLREKVSALTAASPEMKLHGRSKGVAGSPPDLAAIRRGSYSSALSPMFTDLRPQAGAVLTGAAALSHAENLVSRPRSASAPPPAKRARVGALAAPIADPAGGGAALRTALPDKNRKRKGLGQ